MSLLLLLCAAGLCVCAWSVCMDRQALQQFAIAALSIVLMEGPSPCSLTLSQLAHTPWHTPCIQLYCCSGGQAAGAGVQPEVYGKAAQQISNQV